MSSKKNQYQAYSIATRTVGKTRQVVMLYDGAIRFLKHAQVAIAEGRYEDRFNLLTRTSDIILGLQSSIDFTQGGEVAHTLNRFYTNMSIRILSINFHRSEGRQMCEDIIEDLKRMRDIWDDIDRNGTAPEAAANAAPPFANAAAGGGNVTA